MRPPATVGVVHDDSRPATVPDPVDAVAAIERVFASGAALAYLGEDVTMVEHQLQAAAHARGAGRPEAIVIAALVHDIGHMIDHADGELDATAALVAEIDALLDLLPQVIGELRRLSPEMRA